MYRTKSWKQAGNPAFFQTDLPTARKSRVSWLRHFFVLYTGYEVTKSTLMQWGEECISVVENFDLYHRRSVFLWPSFGKRALKHFFEYFELFFCVQAVYRTKNWEWERNPAFSQTADLPTARKSRVSFPQSLFLSCNCVQDKKIGNRRETRLFPKWADLPTARKSRVSFPNHFFCPVLRHSNHK